ncbi:MAG TPA: hypothetical protein VLF21_01495 [Candidatus Saccharimonadales bacterium]|nr:hypothetical protein [Candidatus Saccharimonadales bacterium]
MDPFAQAALKIIAEQRNIIGPLALEQANKVKGLKIDWENQKVEITGNKTEVIDALVAQYKNFFGQTSVEVCKDAVKSILQSLPQAQVPNLLR